MDCVCCRPRCRPRCLAGFGLARAVHACHARLRGRSGGGRGVPAGASRASQASRGPVRREGTGPRQAWTLSGPFRWPSATKGTAAGLHRAAPRGRPVRNRSLVPICKPTTRERFGAPPRATGSLGTGKRPEPRRGAAARSSGAGLHRAARGGFARLARGAGRGRGVSGRGQAACAVAGPAGGVENIPDRLEEPVPAGRLYPSPCSAPFPPAADRRPLGLRARRFGGAA